MSSLLACPRCRGAWACTRFGALLFVACGCGKRRLRTDGRPQGEWAALLGDGATLTVAAVGGEAAVWDEALRHRRAGMTLVVARLDKAEGKAA